MGVVGLRTQKLQEQTVFEDNQSGGAASPPREVCSLRTAAWFRPLRFVGAAGLSGFVLAILVLHGVRPNLDPAQHTISEYALGSYGWLMRVAFFALGVGTLATVVSLRAILEPSLWCRVGLVVLAGMALGLFLDGVYNTDHLRVPATFDGTIHGVGTWILALTLPGAALILGSYLARTSTWRLKARALQALGAAQLGAIVVFEMSPDTYRGTAERLVTVLAVATLALLQSLSAPPMGRQVAPEIDQTASEHDDRVVSAPSHPSSPPGDVATPKVPQAAHPATTVAMRPPEYPKPG